MSILERIQTTVPKAPRITLYGKPGVGKSTFASTFPGTLFLLTEDPAVNGIQALPVAQTLAEVWANVKELLALEELPFNTLVVDSVSKLDELVVKKIQDEEPKKGVPFGACCGGFGKAYERAEGIHKAFKKLMDRFTERGVTVIYICHLTVTKVKQPDADDYDVYSIVMNHERSRHPYIDDVDCVLFGRLKSYTQTLDTGRTIVNSTKNRILVTGVNDSNVSKNRFSMPDEIPMTYDDFSKYIPFYNSTKDKDNK